METLQTIKEYSGLKKSEINTHARSFVESVMEQGNPLQAAETIAALENFIKSVKEDKRFTDYVREEAGKHGKQYTSPSGAKIELAEVGSKYDFSLCNDEKLSQMESDLSVLETSVKARKEMLKTVPVEGLVVTDQETGETYTVYPPSKTSTSSFKITLAK